MTSSAQAIKRASRPWAKRPGVFRSIRKDWQLYSLLLVPMAFVILFKYGPYLGLAMAFQDYKAAKGLFGSEWVGFDVFKTIFSKRDFGKAVGSTLLLNMLDLVFSFPMPVILALLLNEIRGRIFKRLSQTLLYLPHFLSWIIIGAVAYQLFSLNNGVVNALMENLGAKRIPFLQEDAQWLVSYVAIGVWQSMGWGTIVYLAAITSVNPELHEAATVDGAGRWKRCLHVTLPCIRSTIVVLLIMNLGKVMGGSFERVFALANAKVTQYTTTIPVLVYRWGIVGGKFNQATALGLFQSVIGVLLVVVSDFVAKRLGEDGLI